MMDQMSVFEALDTWDAVEIRPEECLEGRTAWVIEYAKITNSPDYDAKVQYCMARPRRIVFEKDSRLDGEHGWSLYWHTDDGLASWGAYGCGWQEKYYFATQPTWSDCQRFVRERWKKYAGQPIRKWREKVTGHD